MPIARRTHPALDQVLEDKSGEDALRSSTREFASGTSFGGNWEVVCTPPGHLARSGAELRVSGVSFGEGTEHLQSRTSGAHLTDEVQQSAVADVANLDSSESPEDAVSSPDRLPPQLITKAHERALGEDAVSVPGSQKGAVKVLGFRSGFSSTGSQKGYNMSGISLHITGSQNGVLGLGFRWR